MRHRVLTLAGVVGPSTLLKSIGQTGCLSDSDQEAPRWGVCGFPIHEYILHEPALVSNNLLEYA